MNLQKVNIYVYIMNIYVIISLFLFLREFTRVKWSENKNEWRVEREESLSGVVNCRQIIEVR